MSEAEQELAPDPEHQVTPLELLFDLTFVFAMTQVTVLLADDPTWGGVLRGMLVLAALWWGWGVYAWLTSAIDVDEGGVRLAMLAAMGAMFGVALAVPGLLATTRSCSVSRTSSYGCFTSSSRPSSSVTTRIASARFSGSRRRRCWERP